MTEYIGNVPVPTVAPSGALTLSSDWGFTTGYDYKTIAHEFLSGDSKIEQRYLVGTGAPTYSFTRLCNMAELEYLKSFWESHQGPYVPFTLMWPPAGGPASAKTVRFKDSGLTWSHSSTSRAAVGINLIEEISQTPDHVVSSTVDRFPTAISAQLAEADHEVIPLVKIVPREVDYPALYLSNRRCKVGGQLYQPRIVRPSRISQSMNGESDNADFHFGDIDFVMSTVAEQVLLDYADVYYKLYHVNTGTLIELWRGYIVSWQTDDDGVFDVSCADGMYDLTLSFPTRKIVNSCWKKFKDGLACTAGDVLNSEYPSASLLSCDKGFETPNGCAAHNNITQFGGTFLKPQLVRTKDNSTGIFGAGRSPLTSVSVMSNTAKGKPLQQIYTDSPMPVKCQIIAGRDEGDFYAALGIVGEGPLGAYGTLIRKTDPPSVVRHTLDGFENHGPGNYGLREGLGTDPSDFNFSLSEGGSGVQKYGTERAAGVAAIELRRKDEKGFQLSTAEEHSMEAIVALGRSCWVWTALGARSLVPGCTNPIWIALDVYIRAKGLWFSSTADVEKLADITFIIAQAGYCDAVVPKIIGSGTEKQFKFRGVLGEEKPARQWIEEVLENCLGYYTWVNGKIRFGIRTDYNVTSAYALGNIIKGSLKRAPRKPDFNHLTVYFGDEDFEYNENSIEWYDEQHAQLTGGTVQPVYTKATKNLVGTSNASQSARIAIVRLREEVGGFLKEHYRAARKVSFATTLLGLDTYPGQVISVTSPKMPGGFGKLRVKSWEFDEGTMSIGVNGDSIIDQMYDLTVGPRVVDVQPDNAPGNSALDPSAWGFDVETDGRGTAIVRNLYCKNNGNSVDKAKFSFWYVAEESQGPCWVTTSLGASDTSFGYAGDPPIAGQYILVDDEIMYVSMVTPSSDNAGTAQVVRAELGTIAAAHPRKVRHITLPPGNTTLYVPGHGFRVGDYVTSPTGDFLQIIDISGDFIVTLRPLSGVADGSEVYTDSRVIRLVREDKVYGVSRGAFLGSQRPMFEWTREYAGLVAVQGTLFGRYGNSSEPVGKTFVGKKPGNRLRLGGSDDDTIQFSHPNCPGGVTWNAFESFRIPKSRSLSYVRAEVRGGVNPPYATPRALTMARPAGLIEGGKITLGGAPSLGSQVMPYFGNLSTDKNYVGPAAFTVTTETTLAQVATNLAQWLNDDESFSPFFQARAAGNDIWILDKSGLGGTAGVQTSGTMTATITGMTSPLGVKVGRRYAVTYRNNTTMKHSAPSELSASTGPTGAASRIELGDVPMSQDPGVDAVLIWAVPDGAEAFGLNTSTPLYLIASVANGDPFAIDDVPESGLTSKPQYDGSSAPSSPGVHVMINRDGGPWMKLYVENNQAASSLISGLPLGPISEGSEITIDIDNLEDAREILLTLR